MLRIGFRTDRLASSQPRLTMIQRLQDNFPALCRLAMGGGAIVSWYYGMSDPAAGLYAVGRYHEGATLLWLMALIGGVVVLDVLINDWSPSYLRIGKWRIELSWHRTFRYRHYLFAALAFCYAAQPFVADRTGHSVSLLLFFYWHSFLNIAVAFLDAKLRSRGPGWQRACS